jgi:hypothetical protein
MSSKKHFSLSRKPEMFSQHPARTTFFLFFFSCLTVLIRRGAAL